PSRARRSTSTGRRREMVLTVPPGNGRWRHRSANQQSQNERPIHVLHKPDKLISYRQLLSCRFRTRENTPMAITYEVLALRYGILVARLQFQNYIIPDDHAAPDPLDFYVSAIRGNGRTIVMDTGFNPVSAKRRGRELLRSPAEALLQAGIDPAEVRD